MLGIPLDRFVKDRVESGLAVASNLQGLWWMYSRMEEEETQPKLGSDTRIDYQEVLVQQRKGTPVP